MSTFFSFRSTVLFFYTVYRTGSNKQLLKHLRPSHPTRRYIGPSPLLSIIIGIGALLVTDEWLTTIPGSSPLTFLNRKTREVPLRPFTWLKLSYLVFRIPIDKRKHQTNNFQWRLDYAHNPCYRNWNLKNFGRSLSYLSTIPKSLQDRFRET